MTRTGDSPRLFDEVPFEGPIDDARAQASQPETVRPRDWRRALGWSATSAPVAFLLVTGIVLGPQGISLMPQSLLSSLVPVIPVAVAALGVLVGLGVADRRAGDRKVFAAACLDAGVSMVVVWVGIALILLWVAPAFTPSSSWALLLAGSVCAATSLTLPRGDPLEPRSIRCTRHGAGRAAASPGRWTCAGMAPGRFFHGNPRAGRPSDRRDTDTGCRPHGCCSSETPPRRRNASSPSRRFCSWGASRMRCRCRRSLEDWLQASSGASPDDDRGRRFVEMCSSSSIPCSLWYFWSPALG